MTLQVNGKTITLTDVTNISGLLAFYQLEKKILVVERNGEIIDRSNYADTPIMDGDRIEIVHFVGGG
ncbi:sulfur carrier protein ThiS [Brevibacillus dissolubilis]|uniref:sulfur carrier protein ThiS n=1 Tax=Brevibacillus dissolubilis TaxID=1844116 RepID=UPI001115DC31|nr:sulfur carrier protein ThiS [Brevibacillus dissolubilis]